MCGHGAAKGVAGGDKRKLGKEAGGFRHRRAHRRLRKLRRGRALSALLHVRELVAERGHAAFEKSVGDRSHEGVRHARSGTMGEHVAGACISRDLQQTRHAPLRIKRDDHRLRCHDVTITQIRSTPGLSHGRH